MPDSTIIESRQRMTYRQRLEAIAANFEHRERVSRGHALRALKSDLDTLWRIARDEELDLIGVNNV